MRNPFLEEVKELLNRSGVRTAKLIHESYSHQNFGNAEAIFQLGNIRIRFVRDRDDGSLQIGGPAAESVDDFHSFVEIALWRGWLSVQALRTEQPIDFDKPPSPPRYNLSQMLGLVVQELDQIERDFSPDDVEATLARLLKDAEV